MNSTGTINKPFSIEKRRVYEAYKAVKSNRGAAGVDGQTLEMFETDYCGESLQNLKSHVLRDVLSTFSARGLPSKEDWRRKDFRCAHCQRSDRADGGQADD